MKARSRSVVVGLFLLSGFDFVVHVRNAHAAGPTEEDTLRKEAQAAFGRKDYKTAASLLQRAHALEPARASTLKDLAVALAADGRVDEAAVAYRKYLVLAPKDEEAELTLATTLSWSKDPALLAESEQRLTAFLVKHPNPVFPAHGAARLQRARVRAWQKHITESAEDYRAYLTTHRDDDPVVLELARTLSWSQSLSERLASIEVFDGYLARHPTDEDARLARARAFAWSGKSAEAVRDLRAYVAARPADRDGKLELASALGATKDRASWAEAVRVYTELLQTSPNDVAVLRKRAQLYTWSGAFDQAEVDYKKCFELAPADDTLLLERAQALYQGASPSDAVPLFDRYIEKHPKDVDARSARARALLWSGEYGRAESELDALMRDPDAATPPKHEAVALDLARLYAQTSRRHEACDLIEEVLERNPKNEVARAELERVRIPLGSRLDPSFFFYADKSNIVVLASGVEARFAFNRNYGLLVSSYGYSLGTFQETLLAARTSAGAFGHYKMFDFEASIGPRFYEHFEPNYGTAAKVRFTPVPELRFEASHQYDDIYFDLLQPASLSAGVRGHALFLTGDIRLPFRTRISGRIGTRQLQPDNHSFDATATALVNIKGPLSAGYNVQYIGWTDNDPSYWSPQAFAAHLGIIRFAGMLGKGTFGYDVQGTFGAAGERIRKAPDSGFGISFGGSAALSYEVSPRLVLRLGMQYSQTVRRIPKAPVGGSAANPLEEEEDQETRYWWLAGNASGTLYF